MSEQIKFFNASTLSWKDVDPQDKNPEMESGSF
jgi:hypothetical protein